MEIPGQKTSAKVSLTTGVAPWLSVRDSIKALAFYKDAFAAKEIYLLQDPGSGALLAKLSIDGAEFWIGEESPAQGNYSPVSLGGSTVRIILTVADPDALFARVIAAGASEVFPVSEDYGWRLGRLKDPFGHDWEIGHPLESV
jgi:PhnB protein